MLPVNLTNLNWQEEVTRNHTLSLISNDEKIRLHITIVEGAMGVANIFRQIKTDDQDLKVIQLFAVRIFNAFGSSLKLALSGYNQNAALILRDILETVYLLDYFASNRDQIARWRHADAKTKRTDYSPAAIRKALDLRDKITDKQRHETYRMFSELAGHPTMNSILMLKPQRDGDAIIGPFVEFTGLKATFGEMGKLAEQVGTHINRFYPTENDNGLVSRRYFAAILAPWQNTFYPRKDTNS